MSKLRNLLQHYAEKGTPFKRADAIVDEAFDKRERHEDDELDTVSFQCAYLDGIARSGWTQVDYEYVFNRADETFNEESYLKETSDGERYVDGQEYGDHPYYQEQEAGGYDQCDDAGCLGNPEAGGEPVGACAGLAGGLDLLDPQPCASRSTDDSEYFPRCDDSGCTTDTEAVI